MNISPSTASYISICFVLGSEGRPLNEWRWRPEEKGILKKEKRCKAEKCLGYYARKRTDFHILNRSGTKRYWEETTHWFHQWIITIYDWVLSFVVPGLQTTRSHCPSWQTPPWGLKAAGLLGGPYLALAAPVYCVKHLYADACLITQGGLCLGQGGDSLPNWS